MNSALLGSIVQIINHYDPDIVGKLGTVTAVTGHTVSVQIDPEKTTTRQIPITNVIITTINVE